MKNIFKILLISFALVYTGCDEDLDINTDPNSPPNINRGLSLAAAEASLMTVTGGVLTNLGGFWAQYHTQAPSASQFENIDQYNINITFADRLWTELYAGCLNDLEYTLNEANSDGDTGTALIATALKAYTYQILVDLFDAIPYTEALQGVDNFTPALTPGDEVYADLIAKLEEAKAAYEANPVASDVGTQDMIYGADMDDWIKFVNTLELKLYMRMAYTSMANPTAVNALLAEGNFITSDAKFANFGTSLNQRNPFYEVQVATTGLGEVNNVASTTLRDFYLDNGDPRLEAAFKASNAGTYVSIVQGSGNDFNDTASAYARPNIRQRTPVFIISMTESYFLQAEALIRYAGGAGAKDMYDMGVLASFQAYQSNFFLDAEETTPVFTAADAAQYAADLTAAGGVYEYQAGADTETTVRQVMIQKWAALPYINNIEGYIESTRTKFPEVVEEGTENYSIGNRVPSRISVLPGTQIPSILFYPDDEANRNPNIVQRSSLTENVWWDQKPD